MNSSNLSNYHQQIISKYFTNYKDYNTLFIKNKNINKLYNTTFNYLFLNSQFVLSKTEIIYILNIINKHFPNIKTIELNYNIYYIATIEEIGNIIKNYKLFKKFDLKHKFVINIYKFISSLDSKYELNRTNIINKIFITSLCQRFDELDIKILNKLNKLIKLNIIKNILQNNINLLIPIIFTINNNNESEIELLLNQPFKIVFNFISYTTNLSILNTINPKYINNNKIYYTYNEVFINYNPILFNNSNDENNYLISHSKYHFIFNHIANIKLLKDNVLNLLRKDTNYNITIKNTNIKVKVYSSLNNKYDNILYIILRSINNVNICIKRNNYKIKFTNDIYINNYIKFIIMLKLKFNFYNYYNININIIKNKDN